MLEYNKLYENKEWLQEEMRSGNDSRAIASKLNVSYKLVNLWLLKFNLIKSTPEIKLP
jgi:hypothetical protein